MNYQYHITVKPLRGQAVDSFSIFCHQLGGKAVLIQLPCGETVDQPMLSITTDRDFDLKSAIADANRVAEKLNERAFSVCRIKIEIPAANYQEVEIENFVPYFEWHGLIDYTPSEALHIMCEDNKLHISKNAIVDNKRYLTLRVWESLDEFLAKIQNAHQSLSRLGVKVVKEKNEYCVYDNNIKIDKGWA